MKIGTITLLVMFGAIALFPQTGLADDLADLKAAHQRMLTAMNTGDVQGVFEVWQEGAVWLVDTFAFPVVTTKEQGIGMFTSMFKTHSYRVRWYKVDYRVVDDTGLVWGLAGREVINKATGVGKRTFFKASLVFVRSEGKWGCVMEHISPIQQEVELF